MPNLMEIIEFLDDKGDTMVQRMPETGSGEFKFGAQLIVRESQKAIFFRDGKALDVFDTGRHVLKTQNIPILTKLITSIGYGKESPFKSEVYFLNMKLFRNLTWGTKEPIIFRDSELKIVRIRSFGAFSITIKNPSLFLNKVVGTQNLFKDIDILNYLRTIIVQKLHVVLGETFKTIIDIPKNFDTLSLLIKSKLLLDFDGLGLELHDLFINSISVPEDVQQMIDTRSGMSAVGDIDDYLKFQVGQSMKESAKNQNSSTGEGIGIGAGLGMGMVMPQMINDSIQKNKEKANDSQNDALDKIKKLKELLDSGAINEEEFSEAKKRILNNL
jgi:membrane protease subunit (stomatin/prohibitin family)